MIRRPRPRPLLLLVVAAELLVLQPLLLLLLLVKLPACAHGGEATTGDWCRRTRIDALDMLAHDFRCCYPRRLALVPGIQTDAKLMQCTLMQLPLLSCKLHSPAAVAAAAVALVCLVLGAHATASCLLPMPYLISGVLRGTLPAG